MLKTNTCLLISGLSMLALTAQGQTSRWRAGLLGAATYNRFSHDFQLQFASPGGNTIRTTHEAAWSYGLGLSVERELNDQWALELQPRYQRLRSDFIVRAGGQASYAHAAGGAVQLPVGARYSFGAARGRVVPYVLGHVVLGRAKLQPRVDALLPDYQDPMDWKLNSSRPGYAGTGKQWQLGLEAGAGVRLVDLLAVNLLAYYGLNDTRLAVVRSDRFVSTGNGQNTQLTTTGTMRGHLLSLAVQGVLYLHH